LAWQAWRLLCADEIDGRALLTICGMLRDMTLSDADLKEHLEQQILLLETTCRSYDDGNKVTYLSLATIIRTLVHDTANSRSMLGQLGIKSTALYPDHVPQMIVERLEDPESAGFLPGLVMLSHSGLPEALWTYVSLFQVPEAEEQREVSFDAWWQSPRMVDNSGNRFTRRNLVLGVANKHGGTHVDSLPVALRALAREASMGVSFKSDDPYLSPVPAAIRQIAEELHSSIRPAI